MIRFLEAVASVAVVALIFLVVGLGVTYARHRPRRELGAPDHVTDSVVSDLMTELRKYQAEAEHWKRTAERLQRELDER